MCLERCIPLLSSIHKLFPVCTVSSHARSGEADGGGVTDFEFLPSIRHIRPDNIHTLELYGNDTALND